MPYINQKRADVLLHSPLGELFDAESVGGDLNFAICTLVRRFLETRKSGGHPGQPRYRDFEDVMGAIQGAYQEFYRLLVEPYEDRARAKGADPFYFLVPYARGELPQIVRLAQPPKPQSIRSEKAMAEDKLFKRLRVVSVTIETLVFASSDEEAEEVLVRERALEEEVENVLYGPQKSDIKIKDFHGNLPSGFDKNCIPWGSEDDRTYGELLEEAAAEASAEAEDEDGQRD